MPESFALPRALVSAVDACAHHTVDAVELREFRTEERSGTDSLAPWSGKDCSVRFAFTGEELAVSFHRGGDLGAGTGRPPVGLCFVLQPGQWGRVLYNGRFADPDTAQWYYRKTVFNVGSFRSVNEDVFLSSPPVRVCSHMARLR